MKKVLICMLLLLSLTLCACIPATDDDSATEKMTKAGYNVTIDSSSTPSYIYTKCGIYPSYLLSAIKDDDGIYAFAFKSEENAKKAKDAVSEWAKNQLPGKDIVQKDEWVYFGTDAAVKAFTK